MQKHFFSSRSNTLLLLALMFLVVVLTETLLQDEQVYMSLNSKSDMVIEKHQEGLIVPTIKLY